MFDIRTLPTHSIEAYSLARRACRPLADKSYLTNLIEFGVGQGRTSALLLDLAHGFDSTYFACDSFAGLPHGQGDFQQGDMDHWSGPEEFRQGLCLAADLGLGSAHLEIVPGIFPASLGRISGSNRFAFAYIDCDLEDGIEACYRWVRPRMLQGGIIAAHNCGNRMCPWVEPLLDRLQFFTDPRHKIIQDKHTAAQVAIQIREV